MKKLEYDDLPFCMRCGLKRVNPVTRICLSCKLAEIDNELAYRYSGHRMRLSE